MKYCARIIGAVLGTEMTGGWQDLNPGYSQSIGDKVEKMLFPPLSTPMAISPLLQKICLYFYHFYPAFFGCQDTFVNLNFAISSYIRI